MNKKYAYFIDNVQVSRNDFFKELKRKCQRVVDTQVIAGWCGVDLMGFDEKSYRKYVRDINNGANVVFLSAKSSMTFKRKEV